MTPAEAAKAVDSPTNRSKASLARAAASGPASDRAGSVASFVMRERSVEMGGRPSLMLGAGESSLTRRAVTSFVAFSWIGRPTVGLRAGSGDPRPTSGRAGSADPRGRWTSIVTANVPRNELAAAVHSAGVIHADETSWRQERRKTWLWVAVTALITVFTIAGNRSAKVAQAVLGMHDEAIALTDRCGS